MEQGFIIDGWRVIPVLNQIERGDAQRHLKPRSMQVLAMLASAGGDVVTRSEVMDAVWGRSMVTEDVLTQSIVEIRKAFDDDARNPRVIETIRKVGFRLIAEVRPLVPEPPSDTQSALVDAPRRFGWGWALAISAALLVSAAMWKRGPVDHSPGFQPSGAESVAVMPFVSLGGDPAQEYFSQGLSEELLNALARLPGLRVLARTSAFAIAGQDLDARVIGERLGVSKILKGSVRQSGGRIWITVQIIDARTGYHVWSETWDRNLDDILKIQDEISSTIAQVLLDDHPGAEWSAASGAETSNVEAFDLYLLGRYYQKLGKQRQARERFERAIQADPSYARAFAGLAETYLMFREVPASVWQPETPDYQTALQLADEAIQTALQLDPSLVDALVAESQLLMARLERERAGFVLQQALTIEPNSARVLHQMARLQTVEGQFDAAVEQFTRAQVLDPLNARLIADFSRLKALMGLDEVANNLLLRLIEAGIESPVIYETLMLNAEDFGRYDERIRWGHEFVHHFPNRASALAELGDAYTLVGMLDIADRWISSAEAISSIQAFKARQRWLWVQHRDQEFLESADRMLLQSAISNDSIISPAQSATLGIGAIAKLQAGKPEVASLYADRYMRTNPTLLYRGTHRVLYTQTVLAMAQRASGNEAAADATIRDALERGRAAEALTVADYPPLLRQMGVLYALKGEFELAVAYTRRSVDSGWRAWRLEGRKPGNDPNWRAFTALNEYGRIQDIVEADIARMRAQVEQDRAFHLWAESASTPFKFH